MIETIPYATLSICWLELPFGLHFWNFTVAGQVPRRLEIEDFAKSIVNQGHSGDDGIARYLHWRIVWDWNTYSFFFKKFIQLPSLLNNETAAFCVSDHAWWLQPAPLRSWTPLLCPSQLHSRPRREAPHHPMAALQAPAPPLCISSTLSWMKRHAKKIQGFLSV